MNKKEYQKIVLGILIVVLFGLLLLTILSFSRKSEDNIIEDNPIKKEEIKFQNNSSMNEKEIRELLEMKREEIKNFIISLEYYKISEVGKEYTIMDDKVYLVLGENNLQKFKELVTEEFYTIYWEKLTEIVPKETIDIKERIYQAPLDLFDELYARSAIAQINVNEEKLILKKATDEKIEAIENIKLCDEETELCTRDDKYDFVLEKENDVWKIAKLI